MRNNAPPERRLNDTIEQEGAINQRCEAHDLKPLERFPAQPERHYPDEERTASVDRRSGSRADSSGHRETEKVESTKIAVSKST